MDTSFRQQITDLRGRGYSVVRVARSVGVSPHLLTRMTVGVEPHTDQQAAQHEQAICLVTDLWEKEVGSE